MMIIDGVQFGRWKRLEAMEVVAWSVFFVVFVPFFFERFFVLRHCREIEL